MTTIQEKSDNTKKQMRKGILEFCTLLAISKKNMYAADILTTLQEADLIVVEGTLYPLLSRLKRDGLVTYNWEESTAGPPRKYYALTKDGTALIESLKDSWTSLASSIDSLITSYEKST